MKIDKKTAQYLKPMINIGKDGITPALIAEMHIHVKKDGGLKVKANPSAYDGLDRKTFFTKLAEEASLKLIDVRGHTAVYVKK